MTASTNCNRKPEQMSAARSSGIVAAVGIAAAVIFVLTLAVPVTIDTGSVMFTWKSANAKNDKDVENALPWRVVAATGPVRYRDPSPVGWQAVSVGLIFEPYTEIETGADGQLALYNGQDQMTLAPNSVVTLPPAVAGAPDIAILQSAGQVNYKVESRRRPTSLLSRIGQLFLSKERPTGRFDVYTPRLVAAVKGTAFSVSVGEQHASVAVTEGVVSVSSTAGGSAIDVSVGKTVTAASLTRGLFVVATPASATSSSGSESSGSASSS
jgi:hypothetical protein